MGHVVRPVRLERRRRSARDSRAAFPRPSAAADRRPCGGEGAAPRRGRPRLVPPSTVEAARTGALPRRAVRLRGSRRGRGARGAGPAARRVLAVAACRALRTRRLGALAPRGRLRGHRYRVGQGREPGPVRNRWPRRRHGARAGAQPGRGEPGAADRGPSPRSARRARAARRPACVVSSQLGDPYRDAGPRGRAPCVASAPLWGRSWPLPDGSPGMRYTSCGPAREPWRQSARPPVP